MADWWNAPSPESVPYAGYEERMRAKARTPAELALIEKKRQEQAEAGRLAGEQAAKQKVRDALVARAVAGDPIAVAALAGGPPPVSEIPATPGAIAPYLPGTVPAPTMEAAPTPEDLSMAAARQSFLNVPEGDFKRFAESRQGQPVSPDYLGIPDYEVESTDPRALGERAQFLDEFVKQKMAGDVAWAQAEQAKQTAEIDPRERMMAEVELERRKAELTGAEAGVRTAEAENIRTRTEILRDPVAVAAKQGTATAEELIHYRERVLAQARSEVDPTSVAALAASMVAKKLAKSPEEAKRMAEEALIQAHYEGILADDPQLRQILARTGMIPGGMTGLPGTT